MWLTTLSLSGGLRCSANDRARRLDAAGIPLPRVGHEQVSAVLHDACLSAVNLCEVLGRPGDVRQRVGSSRAGRRAWENLLGRLGLGSTTDDELREHARRGGFTIVSVEVAILGGYKGALP